MHQHIKKGILLILSAILLSFLQNIAGEISFFFALSAKMTFMSERLADK